MPKGPLQTFINEDIQADSHLCGIPVSVSFPDRNPRDVIHQERPALFSFAQSIKDHQGHASALCDEHLTLAPLAAGIQITANSKHRARCSGRSEPLIPVLAGLKVIRIEEVLKARCLDNGTHPVRKFCHRGSFAAAALGVTNKNPRLRLGWFGELSDSLREVTAAQVRFWLYIRRRSWGSNALEASDESGKSGSIGGPFVELRGKDADSIPVLLVRLDERADVSVPRVVLSLDPRRESKAEHRHNGGELGLRQARKSNT